MSSLAFIGVLLIAGGVFYIKREHQIISNSVITTGHVVNLIEHKRSSKGRMRTTYKPEIRFVDNTNRAVLFQSRMSSNHPDLKVGDSVKVAYDRSNSSDVRILKFLYTFGPALIVCALGVAFLLVGVGFKYGEHWMAKAYVERG